MTFVCRFCTKMKQKEDENYNGNDKKEFFQEHTHTQYFLMELIFVCWNHMHEKKGNTHPCLCILASNERSIEQLR